MSYKFLDEIDSPTDLKSLDVVDLPLVCEELRRFIIESEAVNPAHFGANLGVIDYEKSRGPASNTSILTDENFSRWLYGCR